MRRLIDTEKARRAEAMAELEHFKAELARMTAELEATKKAAEEARLAAEQMRLTVTPSATEEIQCSICCYAMVDPTTLVCGHSGCLGCMHTALAKSQRRCPLCRVNQPRDATLWARKEQNKNVRPGACLSTYTCITCIFVGTGSGSHHGQNLIPARRTLRQIKTRLRAQVPLKVNFVLRDLVERLQRADPGPGALCGTGRKPTCVHARVRSRHAVPVRRVSRDRCRTFQIRPLQLQFQEATLIARPRWRRLGNGWRRLGNRCRRVLPAAQILRERA